MLRSDRCPICGGATRVIWPTNFITLDEMKARYLRLAYEASGNNMSDVSRVLDIHYQSVSRALKAEEANPAKIAHTPATDFEKEILFHSHPDRHELAPAAGQSLGTMSGTWSIVASSPSLIVYSIRVSRAKSFDSRRVVDRGERPEVMLYEDDDNPRLAVFGEPQDHPVLATFASAGIGHLIGTVVPLHLLPEGE